MATGSRAMDNTYEHIPLFFSHCEPRRLTQPIIYIYISSSGNGAPYHPVNCTKEILNIEVDHPEWLSLVERLNDTNLTEAMEYLASLSPEEPCQRILYALPFYYVGAR